MKSHIHARINGEHVEFLCETTDTLLHVLRNILLLTGSKEGCGTGDCGACSVMLNDRLVCACLVLAVEVRDAVVETIEGVAVGARLHPVQQSFLDHGALQCGICTPGLVMAAKALLKKNSSPSEEEVRFWIAGNMCRCTGYDKIVRAILDAGERLRSDEGGGGKV